MSPLMPMSTVDDAPRAVVSLRLKVKKLAVDAGTDQLIFPQTRNVGVENPPLGILIQPELLYRICKHGSAITVLSFPSPMGNRAVVVLQVASTVTADVIENRARDDGR